MNSGDRLIEHILILRCQIGDADALAELIEQYQRPLRYFISRLLGDPKLAEDIFQDTWLITVLYFLAMHTLKDIVLRGREAFLTRDEFELISYSDMGLKVLALIAVLLTYLAYCKSETLTILQIYAKLAAIEDQLKTIARDKSPAQDVDASAQAR